jgi:hypothetical protein
MHEFSTTSKTGLEVSFVNMDNMNMAIKVLQLRLATSERDSIYKSVQRENTDCKIKIIIFSLTSSQI